jgi:6-pyruvoyltetrahydropterin/6-carboxytetrahydropterin synthase
LDSCKIQGSKQASDSTDGAENVRFMPALFRRKKNKMTTDNQQLPTELVRLQDAPLFIDSAQLDRFYDAIARPVSRQGNTTVILTEETVKSIEGKLSAEAGLTFEAAHLLPHAPEGHKCRRLHGHSFSVEIFVSGQVDPQAGWVMDFGDISRAFAPLHAELDHRLLNDISGLDNPTSENICLWLWARPLPSVPGLSRIVVNETCTAGCSYSGR